MVKRLLPGAYRVVVVLYVLGLVGWLLLGLLPVHTDRGSAGAVLLAYLFSLVNLALGALLMVKRPDDLVPRLLTLAFVGTAATFNQPSHAVFHVLGEPPPVMALHFTFHVVSGCAYLLAVVLFPGGELPLPGTWSPRATRLLLGGVTAAVAVVCWRSSFIAHPPFFVAFFGVLVPIVGIVAQTAQLRRASDAVAAEQSRLLRVALLPALAVSLAWLVAGARVGGDVQAAFPVVFAVVPLVLFVAILRGRLWDIDLLASRILLLAMLGLVVAVVYLAVLGLTGAALRGRDVAVVLPLLVVACVAEPLRARCQTLSNLLVFGQRLTPREAVRALVDRFAGIGDVDEVTELVRVVEQSTRARGAALWLHSPDGLVLLARAPDDPSGPTRVADRAALAPATCWPVSYAGATLAVLAVTMPPGLALSRRESALLDDLSHQAGLLVQNALLTLDLARELREVTERAAELRRSRRAVVLAQDRARRRLERDIHDGAQQQLVAFLVMLRAGPHVSSGDVRAVLRSTQETIARLASGGAPEALAEAGLGVALAQATASPRGIGPEVLVDVAVDGLDAPEVQRAVYFCCLEAVQNAAKHAGAHTIGVSVRPAGDELLFEVRDDGRGFDALSGGGGTGLGNLRERLLPLGGEVLLESAPGRGTTVRGRVPVPRIPAQVVRR